MPDRLLRIKDVMARVPLGRSTIYARMNRNQFPRAKDLGGGVVAWRESDILTWMEQLPVSEPAANEG